MDRIDVQPNNACSASSGLKRKRPDIINADEPYKKEPKQSICSNEFNLLHFSDEILLDILLHCDSLTLRNLSNTCRHFENLVKDHRLWNSFDFSKIQLSTKGIKKFMKYIGKDTIEFLICGLVSLYPLDKYRNNTITKNILSTLADKCPNLETLEVNEGFINFEKIYISDFPPSLKKLIFRGCEVPMPRRVKVFEKIDIFLQHLQELSMENCRWFETHDLIVLSKLPHLKRLILRGCISFKDSVPYGSIAARFGFKALTYLDVRDTPIQDSDIQCFNITYSLRELLLECPKYMREREKSQQNRELNSISIDEQKKSDNEKVKSNDLDVIDDESSDSEDDVEENEEEKLKTNSPTTSSSNQFVEFVVQNGSWTMNTGNIPDDAYQRREVNGLRYLISVSDGPVQVLHRVVREQQHEDSAQENRNGSPRQNEQTPPKNSSAETSPSCSTNSSGANEAGPSSSAASNSNKETTEPSTSNSASALSQNGNLNVQRPEELMARQRQRLILMQSNREANMRYQDEAMRIHRGTISDRGICSFGTPRENVNEGIIWIRADALARPADTFIERLTIRHYSSITDVTLRHLSLCAPNLQYLDVTGTSVTEAGIKEFINSKPNCVVISHHNINCND